MRNYAGNACFPWKKGETGIFFRVVSVVLSTGSLFTERKEGGGVKCLGMRDAGGLVRQGVRESVKYSY